MFRWRNLRGNGEKWAGTIYTLCLPVLWAKAAESNSNAPWIEDPTWRPKPGIKAANPNSTPLRHIPPPGAERISVPFANNRSNGAETASVPTAAQKATAQPIGTERGAQGTERGAQGTERGAQGTERRSETALKDVQSSLRSESEILVSKTVPHVVCAGAHHARVEELKNAKERKEARIRKAFLAFPPEDTSPEVIARISGTTAEEVREATKAATS